MNHKCRALLICISLLSYLLAAPSQAYACQCGEGATMEEDIEKTTAIFVGRVTDITPSVGFFHADGSYVTFNVSTVWKGSSVTKLTTIFTGTDLGDCGYPFEVGEKYLVIAQGGARNLTTDICMYQAEFRLDELGEGQTPPPPSRTLPIIAAGVSTLALLTLLFLAHRRCSATPGPTH